MFSRLKNPGQPRRNDKYLRLLGAKAHHELLMVLAERRNWYTELFLISQSPEQTPNVGLVFRHRGKELVLFFRDMAIDGQLGDKTLTGMLEEEGRKKFEQWKQRYAQQELAVK